MLHKDKNINILPSEKIIDREMNKMPGWFDEHGHTPDLTFEEIRTARLRGVDPGRWLCAITPEAWQYLAHFAPEIIRSKKLLRIFLRRHPEYVINERFLR
jgi:hypothetical protein